MRSMVQQFKGLRDKKDLYATAVDFILRVKFILELSF